MIVYWIRSLAYRQQIYTIDSSTPLQIQAISEHANIIDWRFTRSTDIAIITNLF